MIAEGKKSNLTLSSVEFTSTPDNESINEHQSKAVRRDLLIVKMLS